jgi:hypothetical protein
LEAVPRTHGQKSSNPPIEEARPIASTVGDGPVAAGYAGGRGGRGNSKDRRAKRRQSKQGGQSEPNVASVAKAVCFYSPHENDVTSTGGGAQYGATPVVRQSYHQDRPRKYSEAAGDQPKEPAPLGVATRYSHYSPP